MRALPLPWAVQDDPDRRPEPGRPALIHGSLAVVSLGVGFLAGLRWPDALIAPISLVLLGLIQAILAWDDLVQRRRSADQWFRLRPTLLDGRFAWRAAELTSESERRLLARSLRGLVDEAGGRVMPGPVPLNTQALRLCTPELGGLADRLADVGRPVTPAGILAVHDFLASPGSPAYERSRSETLPLVLLELAQGLEPR